MLRISDVLSDLLSSKCVAARDLSRFQAAHEPTGSLSRSAVGKCIGHDVTLGPPLQAIISDGRSGLQRRFDVTRFDELPLCLGAVRPDAGKAIRLQLHPDLQRIRLRLVHSTL